MMKRILLLLLLTPLLNDARAQVQARPSDTAAVAWRKVEGGVDFDIYLDPATVQKTGSLAKVSYLQNRKTDPIRGFWSMAWRMEVNCLTRQGRTLTFAGYAKRMGQGPAKFDQDADRSFVASQKWGDIGDPDEDIRAKVFSFACGTRKR